MHASEVSVDWLQKQSYEVHGPNQRTIDGVAFRPLRPVLDGRGDLTELWSRPWAGFLPPVHVYQSATDFGVVKCWHLHEDHTDQLAVTRGKIQVTLVDIREAGPTFGHVNVFVMGVTSPGLLRVPPGLLHGWKGLSEPEVVITNLQSHLYDAGDEYKFAWDCVLGEVWQPRNG